MKRAAKNTPAKAPAKDAAVAAAAPAPADATTPANANATTPALSGKAKRNKKAKAKKKKQQQQQKQEQQQQKQEQLAGGAEAIVPDVVTNNNNGIDVDVPQNGGGKHQNGHNNDDDDVEVAHQNGNGNTEDVDVNDVPQETTTDDDVSIFTNLFVDFIPKTYSQEKFTELLLPYKQTGGLKEIKFFTRRNSVTNYAFLVFESGIDGKKCQEKLDNILVDGSAIRVRAAKPHSKNFTTYIVTSKVIYVGGVPEEWGPEELTNIFSPNGTISLVRILHNKETQKPKGVAFVHFEDSKAAKAAVEQWNGKTPPNSSKELVIRLAFEKPQRQGFQRQNFPRYGGRNFQRFQRPGPNNGICRYFQQGTCHRAVCPYKHEKATNGEADQNILQAGYKPVRRPGRGGGRGHYHPYAQAQSS